MGAEATRCDGNHWTCSAKEALLLGRHAVGLVSAEGSQSQDSTPTGRPAGLRVVEAPRSPRRWLLPGASMSDLTDAKR